MDVIIVRLFVCFANSNALQHPSSFSIVVKLKEEMFKKSQELFEHRSKEANLIAEISGAVKRLPYVGTPTPFQNHSVQRELWAPLERMRCQLAEELPPDKDANWCLEIQTRCR